jgi:hypothetical protein
MSSTDDPRPRLAWARPLRFARRWGYAVVAEELPTDGASADPAAQQAKWAKLRLLREAILGPPSPPWV